MKIKQIKKMIISGIKVTTNNENENTEGKEKIAQLWEDYTQNNTYTKTLNKVKDISMYGVYSNYVSDHNGDYDVTVGVEVTKAKNPIIIENERYLVFSKKGELPEIIYDTWQEIWDYFENNDEYKRKYSIDFEKYSVEEEIEIYISIEK